MVKGKASVEGCFLPVWMKFFLKNYICYIYFEFMTIRRYLEFYDCFGKFRGLPVEGILGKNESEGANGSSPFLIMR
jgi:hypothetical protein